MNKEFAGGAKQTQLAGDLSAGGTSFTVDDATGYPASATVPHVVAIDLGMSNEEKVLVTRVGDTFTVVTRGYDDTTAQSHSAGATVDHVLDSETLSELVAFVNGDTFLHTTDEAHLAFGTATTNGSGSFTVAHGLALNPGQVLHGSARYKGPSGESVSMSALTVDATNVYGYGGDPSKAARWSFIYTDTALNW